jgi:seryl-tRNA synthetase
MIDIQDLRHRPEAYADAARKKRVKVDVQEFLKLDTQRRELLKKVEDMRSTKNSVSKQVPTMKGEDKAAAIIEMKKVSDELKVSETELESIEKEWQHWMLLMPSIPLSTVPEGKDDTENREVRTARVILKE